MYTDKNVKLINYLIALIPLSLILGNLIVNINIILICLVGIVMFRKETFIIKKNYEILISFFFIYIIIITATNNIPKFDLNPKYQENLLKSIFNLRFLLLFFIINTLIKKDKLNLKPFLYSASFLSFLISIDIIIQVIFGKNLVGFEIIHNKPSSFFGNELIAGSYLQKFILFLLFWYAYKIKNDSKFLIIISLFFIPILLAGNRMPMLIFLSSIFIYFLIEKKIKIIFVFLLISTLTIFLSLKYPLVYRLDVQLKVFKNDMLQMFYKAPKLFLEKNYKDDSIIFGSAGYLIHFNSGIQIWKENKIFGKGLKSFPLNCKYGDNQTCNTHPHNYIIEIMLDTGLLGLIIIYSVFLIGLTNFLKFYFLKYNERIKLLTLPFFLIIFFEFFPFRSTGSFFTTSVSTIIFLFLAIFINIEKIKNFYKM